MKMITLTHYTHAHRHTHIRTHIHTLTIPINVKKMTTANEKKAMKALAWISGCLFWKTFTRISPPMMNMKAVSERGGGGVWGGKKTGEEEEEEGRREKRR